ncbi:glycoside hydrolase family 88 protein [Agrococcus sp. ARC_14]|uniref:glycoside hydrolase family 88 protein n=1 Tax=Agrococcus sp. ARC_14 TaxID=2919927 RepID=UPI001F067440|nr:glycoside hydrolase family 88 protein [Agrococcus sp. ARC_14]MCH1882005.1 glycoside hydrolase family 88 protein [Agrococcus sp. ARC_14]
MTSNATTTVTLPSIDVDHAFQVIAAKLERLTEQHPLAFPLFTEGGKWQVSGETWAPEWTSGFLAGQLWAVADRTGDSRWRERAIRYTEAIEPRKHDTGTHDIGFLFTPSWQRWHAHESSARIEEVVTTAARSLATNFNESGNYLRTWVDAGSSFVDIMMNLDVLYFAAEVSGDVRLAEVATRHALTTRRFLVRGDGTVAHEGWFDPDSGEFLRVSTHQGWRSDSSWVRGLTWAIHGFTSCWLRTGDERFITTARQCADEYIRRTGAALVPPNDWDDPAPALPFEASAGSVAAAGMLQLGEELGDSGAVYAKYGARILERLASEEFLASADEPYEGIIKHATYHFNNGLGIDQSNMWGDYYFVEALERYERLRG